MTNFKAIFFDNDGLLVDTESLWLEATRKTLAPFGITITDEWYAKEVLGKGGEMIPVLLKEYGISQEKVVELRNLRNNLYGEMLKENVKTIDGVREVLEMLEGKFLMGVVTTSSSKHFDIIMEKTGLRKYFSFFVTFEDVVNPKPDPEPYLKAIELSKIPKDQCLVLEDSGRGVKAAKAAGLTCYAIPEAWSKSHDFSSADKVLGSIRELPNILFN